MTRRAPAGSAGGIGGQFVGSDSGRAEAGQLFSGDEPVEHDVLLDCDPRLGIGTRMGALRTGDTRAIRVLAHDPDPVVRYHVLRRHAKELFPEDRRSLSSDPGVARVAEIFGDGTLPVR